MLVRRWLSSCSSSVTGTLEPTTTGGKTMAPENLDNYPTNSLISDTSSSSLNSDTDFSNTSSLPSYSSLPSIPSLQKNLLEFPLSGNYFTSLSSIKPFSTSIHSLALSNNLLYISTSNKNITVYNLESLKPIDVFGDGDGAVKSTVISSNKIFTAHQDCKIRIWENLKNHHQLIASLPTVKDRLLRFPSPSNYVQIRRHKKRLWIDHADAVTSVAVKNDHDRLYSVSWDKSLKIWRVSDLKCLESVNGAHDDAINAVVVSEDGFIYTGSADCRINVWKEERKNGEKKSKHKHKHKHSLVATLERHRSAVNTLALSSDGNVLYSGACDRSILVWEREDSAQHMTVTGALRGHKAAVLCLVNVNDLVFSGSADRTVRIWRRGDGNGYCTVAVLEGHERPVKSVVARFDQDSGFATVYSGGLDGEIKVWQVWVSSLKGELCDDDS